MVYAEGIDATDRVAAEREVRNGQDHRPPTSHYHVIWIIPRPNLSLPARPRVKPFLRDFANGIHVLLLFEIVLCPRLGATQ